jgi:hypothetical protein
MPDFIGVDLGVKNIVTTRIIVKIMSMKRD